MTYRNNREQEISGIVMVQLVLMVLIDFFLGRRPQLRR
jgi:hypothetical protein